MIVSAFVCGAPYQNHKPADNVSGCPSLDLSASFPVLVKGILEEGDKVLVEGGKRLEMASNAGNDMMSLMEMPLIAQIDHVIVFPTETSLIRIRRLAARHHSQSRKQSGALSIILGIPVSKMASNYQERLMTVSEIEVVLENYEIILTQVDKMDPLHDSSLTKQLLHTILDVHMPIIKEELEQLKKQLKGNKTCEAIHKITKMEDRYGKRSHDRSIMKPFLSPIVLLLKLAEELKAFSFAQREEWKQPDWGRLISFREYLEDLQFRSSRGRDKHYTLGCQAVYFHLFRSGHLMKP